MNILKWYQIYQINRAFARVYFFFWGKMTKLDFMAILWANN